MGNVPSVPDYSTRISGMADHICMRGRKVRPSALDGNKNG
jgi:hypothetical protein